MLADYHISDFHIFYRRICITSAHLHISDPHISDFHILYLHIRRSSHLRSSYLINISSHCIASAHLHILDLDIFTFIFRSSYFETTSCLHIFGCSSRNHIFYLIIFKISFCHIYNLNYLRLQNFISLSIISSLGPTVV